MKEVGAANEQCTSLAPYALNGWCNPTSHAKILLYFVINKTFAFASLAKGFNLVNPHIIHTFATKLATDAFLFGVGCPSPGAL